MMLVYAHHAGLPDFNEMENGKEWRNNTIQEHVNNALPDYLSRHEASVRPNLRFKESRKEMPMLKPADIRALFACLTHADHGDAARATNEEPKWSKPPKLRAAERLLALQQYVDSLAQGGAESDRNQLRSAFFVDCSKQQQKSSITFCDAPVGNGKTSRIWLTVNEDARLEQMIRQIEKLEDVLDVHRHGAGHEVFERVGEFFR